MPGGIPGIPGRGGKPKGGIPGGIPGMPGIPGRGGIPGGMPKRGGIKCRGGPSLSDFISGGPRRSPILAGTATVPLELITGGGFDLLKFSDLIGDGPIGIKGIPGGANCAIFVRVLRSSRALSRSVLCRSEYFRHEVSSKP